MGGLYRFGGEVIFDVTHRRNDFSRAQTMQMVGLERTLVIKRTDFFGGFVEIWCKIGQ